MPSRHSWHRDSHQVGGFRRPEVPGAVVPRCREENHLRAILSCLDHPVRNKETVKNVLNWLFQYGLIEILEMAGPSGHSILSLGPGGDPILSKFIGFAC